MALRIGIISDTHRFMRPEALAALESVDHIIHAGDIGSLAVIDELNKIAPVTAVRGNVDNGDLMLKFPKTAVVEENGQLIYVIHNLQYLDLDPEAAGFSCVIYGHSHVPSQEIRKGILYFNPGSAGPLRFHLPPSIGILTIDGGMFKGEIIPLQS